jgi:hypothetical protein
MDIIVSTELSEAMIKSGGYWNAGLGQRSVFGRQ